MYSSASPHWFTPVWLVEKIRDFSPGGIIGLDPCCHPLAQVGAFHELCGTGPDDDGLTADWSGKGFTFVNSPYGRGIGAWQRKCHTADECISLVPARVDTKWFQELCAPPVSQAVCFIKGRLKFLEPIVVMEEAIGTMERDPAPFPSALVYWGKRARQFDEAFSSLGRIWLPHDRVFAVADMVKLAALRRAERPRVVA